MVKRFYKHKLLFDENMPPRTALPRLNEHFDVKHVAMDLDKGGIDDPVVYDLAVELGRIIVTRNVKHFAPLVSTKPDRGIIAIPPHWQPAQIDTKLTALLRKHGPNYFNGQLVRLGTEDEHPQTA
jgi:predicted nuclease of predicted toxin-antitoxin system